MVENESLKKKLQEVEKQPVYQDKTRPSVDTETLVYLFVLILVVYLS